MASSGNFCTLNPLSTKGPTLSRGNIRADSTFYWATYYGTIALPTSGKWYAECRTPNISGPDASFPMGIQDAQLLTYLGDKTSNGNPQYIGMATSTAGEGYSIYTHANGTYSKKYYNGSSSDTSLASASNGDIYQIAVDLDNNKLWFGKNNTWDQSNPSGNGTATYTITNKSYVMGGSASNSEYHIWNFGQDSTFSGGVSAGGNADDNGFGDFKYSPPSGFLALCSANLPISSDIDPAQTDDDFVGGKQFGVVTYTGNGGVLSVTGLGFKPDLVWGKMRSPHAYNNMLYDSSRGANRVLQSDTSNAEIDLTSSNVGLRTFDSDGFTLGSEASLNDSGDSIVAWCWRANGGTTTSFSASGNQLAGTYQANTKSKFSIITYTGSGSTAEVLHGLGTTPNFIIYKARNDTHGWGVYHKSGGTVNTGYNSLLYLNSSNGLASNQNVNIAPDSTKIAFAGNEQLNRSSYNYVMYAWADVEGFQKFGTYVGNGNNDGPFIHLGFRPRLVAIKWLTGVNSAEDWGVFDTARSTTNPSSNDSTSQLQWNRNVVGSNTSAHKIDFLSNGFKLRGNGGLNNTSGATYIYMCWGDVPFKYNNTF